MCVSICVICVIANVMERETEGAREKVFIYECTSKRQGAPHFGATSPNPDQPTPTIDPAEGSTLQCRLIIVLISDLELVQTTSNMSVSIRPTVPQPNRYLIY